MKLIKNVSMFILLSSLLYSCDSEVGLFEIQQSEQSESDSETVAENSHEYLSSNPYTVSEVSMNDIPEIEAFLASKGSKELSSKENGKMYLDRDHVYETVDTLGNKSYSFQFRYKDTPLNISYNLIVEDPVDGKQDTYVMKYISDPDSYSSFFNSGFHASFFNGQAETHKYDAFFDEAFESKTDCPSHDSYGDPIPCLIANITGASGSSSGGGNSYGGPNNMPWSPITFSGSYSGFTISIIHVTPQDGSYVYGSSSVCQHPGECTVLYVVYAGPGIQKAATCPGCPSSNSSLALNIEGRATLLASIIDDNVGLTDAQEEFLVTQPQATDMLSAYLQDNNWSSDSEAFTRSAVRAMMAETALCLFPFIKYPKALKAQYHADYPKLTEYLIYKLPRVAYISKITDAIHEFTDMPISQIQEELQWGNGPELNIIQLDNYKPGETDSDTVGYFDEEFPNKIFLDVDHANFLEQELTDQDEEDAFMFFLGTTVLHEFVHYGDYQDGYDYPGEEGRLFEIKVYGENVQPDRARLILNRNQ